MSDAKVPWIRTLAPPLITGVVTLVATLIAAALNARSDGPGSDLLFPRPTVTTSVTSTVETTTTTATATVTATVSAPGPAGESASPATGGGSSYLADLDPVEGGLSTDPRAVLKRSYAHSVSNLMGGCSQSRPTEWVLGDGVDRFQASLGLDDTSLISTARVQFTVSVDGRRLVTKTVGLKQVQPIDVPVRNGLRLKLDTVLVEGDVRNNCNTEAIAVWGDATVTNS